VIALVQLLISGILLGGIYALAAFGLALIFGVCNILNLAHGEFLMLGALVCFLLGHSLGIDPFAAILLLMPLFFVLGMLFRAGPEHITTGFAHQHVDRRIGDLLRKSDE